MPDMDEEKERHIPILWDAPVILTRDKVFVDNMKADYANKPMRPGQVILLPQDAVLVRLPQVVGAIAEKKDTEDNERVIQIQ